MRATHRYRWAVWTDGQEPRIASSRRQAKRIARKARAKAWLCRHYPGEENPGLSITDFVVWVLGRQGRWFRCLWLCGDVPQGSVIFGKRLADSAHERTRYGRSLRNDGVWKLGGQAQISAAGVYPEITLDGDEAMVCAGLHCVADFRTLRDAHRAYGEGYLPECCYGTIDDRVLRVWVDDEVQVCP